MRRRRSALLSLLVAAPALGRAQPAAEPPAAVPAAQADGPRIRIGLGAAVDTSAAAILYFPIEVARLRIEPELGYLGVWVGDEEAHVGDVGIGLFRLFPAFPGVQGYAGGRFRYSWLDGTRVPAASGWRLAGALGGEWLPVPAAAVGVEFDLGYGESKASLASAAASAQGVSTSEQVFLRVFLGEGTAGAATRASEPATNRSPETPAAPARPARPRSLQRCRSTDECTEGGICFDGYCRR